ncbi:MAG TPA: hypothetical protein VNN55_08735 [bacterium]|nr:hypothetical protein [bacterium]
MTCKALSLSSVMLALAMIAAGCGGGTEQTASAPGQTQSATQSKPKSSAVQTVSVPSGTMLTVALDQQLRTDTHKSGDAFSARTTEALMVDRLTVFPAGAMVQGRLENVEEPHRTAGKAKMTLVFESITDARGKTYAIEARKIVLEGEGDKISDEEKIAGGAVIGGIIGALTSKDKAKGAATGAVVGGAAGGAIALATKGQQLELPAGQRFAVELMRSFDAQVAAR